jgi:hypothetical protein
MFKLFKPPPSSSPASRRVAGEDTGGGWNDLNYLNGWNSDEYGREYSGLNPWTEKLSFG